MHHLECWKKTALGTPIPLFASERLTDLSGKRPILLFGGIHGDEPEGVRLASDTLLYLEEWSHDTKLVPWIVIPCLNVDGFQARTRVNARGVDLNRNYPSQDWSPTADQARYFPGPSAMSEPEVAGIVELIETLDPRLLIHCHSWKPCIVATGTRAHLDGKRLSASSGYELVGEIGYPTPGSLSRYGWYDKKIPVICIEEQENLENLSTIWPRFENAMRAIFSDPSQRLKPSPAETDPHAQSVISQVRERGSK
jgi:protein MpaA